MTLVASVSSSKGGSGKSTTSINLGVALANLGRDVTIIDSNLSTPNLSMYLGAPSLPVTLHHVLSGTAKLADATYTHDSGAKIIPGSISMRDFENLKLKCECGGSMEKIKTEWKGIAVRGWRCKKCKEEVINPVDAQKALEIERARKENKLKVKLRKVGKSNVVTVPSILTQMENLKSGQELEWSVEGKKLVLTP